MCPSDIIRCRELIALENIGGLVKNRKYIAISLTYDQETNVIGEYVVAGYTTALVCVRDALTYEEHTDIPLHWFHMIVGRMSNAERMAKRRAELDG